MIEEMVDFNQAIEAVVDWVNKESNWNDTLLIITADHETGRPLGPDGVHDVENAGKGIMPKGAFKTSSHTNNLVPLFARGNGAEALKARAAKQDPVRGAYLDNTDVANAIHDLWK
jgi:alkaline phosphatase